MNATPAYQLTADDRNLSEWLGCATMVVQFGLGNTLTSARPTPHFE